jgi:hypothetical protein
MSVLLPDSKTFRAILSHLGQRRSIQPFLRFGHLGPTISETLEAPSFALAFGLCCQLEAVLSVASHLFGTAHHVLSELFRESLDGVESLITRSSSMRSIFRLNASL